MAWITLASAIALPLAVAVTFLDPDHVGYLNLRLDHIGAALHNDIPLVNRTIALLCKMAPVSVAVWGLFSLRRLFLLYARDEVFSHAALAALRSVTLALFWYVVVSFIMEAPTSAALSWGSGGGHVTLSIGLNDFAALFLAAAMYVIARVMTEARRIADENARFI